MCVISASQFHQKLPERQIDSVTRRSEPHHFSLTGDRCLCIADVDLENLSGSRGSEIRVRQIDNLPFGAVSG
jgi:hypothetical protein